MLERFSIAIEKQLLQKFDAFISRRKYKTRSEAIRDLIRASFVKEEWTGNEDVVGIITLTYDHHSGKLLEKIMEVQHSYFQNIVSTTHIHLDHHNCLESIITRGRSKDIKDLADKLISLKGVKTGNLSMTSTGVKL